MGVMGRAVDSFDGHLDLDAAAAAFSAVSNHPGWPLRQLPLGCCSPANELKGMQCMGMQCGRGPAPGAFSWHERPRLVFGARCGQRLQTCGGGPTAATAAASVPWRHA